MCFPSTCAVPSCTLIPAPVRNWTLSPPPPPPHTHTHTHTHTVCYGTGKHGNRQIQCIRVDEFDYYMQTSNRTCSHSGCDKNCQKLIHQWLCTTAQRIEMQWLRVRYVYIVVNQLPRWNWHRCKQSVDCIDLCPCATVHTHIKAWTQACRHIWRQACMHEHTHTNRWACGY